MYVLIGAPVNYLAQRPIMCYIYKYIYMGGAHGVMVIIAGNGHGNTSSNPGWDWFHFILH